MNYPNEQDNGHLDGHGVSTLPTQSSQFDDLGEISPREECGVFGVWAPGEDVSKLTYYGL